MISLLLRLIRVAALAAALSACTTRSIPDETGLFTSLPILWGEAEGVADLLNSRKAPHWAVAVLRENGGLRPLDALAGQGPGGQELSGQTNALAAVSLLVMAQPRPLSPQENVALDAWVRGGGRVLLFADPMLTAHSEFSLGDKRRPQDIVLLSPILTRWGLALEFDEDQPSGERQASLLGQDVPVNLAGRFAVLKRARCKVIGGGLAAQCRIGKGRVLALADAALFERDVPDDIAARAGVLRALLAEAAR